MSELPLSPATIEYSPATVESYLADSPLNSITKAPTVPLTPTNMDIVHEEDEVSIVYETANMPPYSPRQVKREPELSPTEASTLLATHVATASTIAHATTAPPAAQVATASLPANHSTPAQPLTAIQFTAINSGIPSLSPLARSIAQLEGTSSTAVPTRPAIQVIREATSAASHPTITLATNSTARGGSMTTTSRHAPRIPIPVLTLDGEQQAPASRAPAATSALANNAPNTSRPTATAAAPSRASARRRASRARNQSQPYQPPHRSNRSRQNGYMNIVMRNDEAEIVRLGHVVQRESGAAGIIIPELAVRDFLIYWQEQTSQYYG